MLRSSSPQNACTWRCDRCGRPIADGHGYIEFVDPEGGYPKWTLARDYGAEDADRLWEAKHALPSGGVTFRADDVPETPIRADVVAYHKRCDPHPDQDSYWFEVERARTARDVLDWIVHLTEKIWFGRREAKAFADKFLLGLSRADGGQ